MVRRQFRWCSANAAHYSPPEYQRCGQCGAPFVEPHPRLNGMARPCPLCGHQNLIQEGRVSPRGVCVQCGHLLAVCSQDGRLLRRAGSSLQCDQCEKGYVIPGPDTWGQVGAGASRAGSTPERLFRDSWRLEAKWRDWLEFPNRLTLGAYSVAAPVLAGGLLFVQDGNRTLHGVDLMSGGVMLPSFDAFDPGGPNAGPAVAGEYVYVAGATGHLAAYAVARVGTEPILPGQSRPVPNYATDLPGTPEEAWAAFRPPAVSDDGNRVVCLWRSMKPPFRYRISCTTVDLMNSVPEADGVYPDTGWLWMADLEEQPLGPAVVDDGGVLFVVVKPNRICRYDPETGERREALLEGSEIRDGALLAFEENLLIANTMAGELVGVDTETLEERWRRHPVRTGRDLIGPGCYVPGPEPGAAAEIWVVDLDGQAEALRAADGAPLHQFPELGTRNLVTAPSAVTGSSMLIPAGEELWLMDRAEGNAVVAVTVPPGMGRICYQPAVAFERVVVATDARKLMAFGVPGRGFLS